MKLISWNVNGIRACVQKGFLDYFHEQKADLFCIQETKCQEDQITLELDGYYQYWHSAVRKGYSGTAIFTKHKPLNVSFGFNGKEEDQEGRVLTLEFEKFYMVNVYTPNSQRDLARLPIRLKWEDDFKNYLNKLDEHKPVILCGDLNVAHNEIDLANPKSNRTNSGFTEEERGKMTALLESGFTDSFRFLNPTKEGSYSWWSYMAKVRERNIGWRIDYFIISNRLQNELINSEIHSHIMGSDHCPVVLTLEDSII
ncbi:MULTISPECIES: exodeoxyribonuclease III [Bacillaceae]|uniref:Exodeoxyribonuclease III n=1 Tax=Gottfriedia luciferensis TaxID=178774 RepID=A0ABX2ZWX6_9BACI|nr:MULTISPECIES: exodeoxyribonuclease III [Bacillaceae]ODG93874.1 exodeoxyribonuclease III [Gottfriedia luciferensis]PGZ88963.1 exodeoxyribonuclease III [Bacillus sp. AFS029533]SFC30908.1 exodeoxyribonuclease-3 [Bacillus sp. UNCCL81]